MGKELSRTEVTKLDLLPLPAPIIPFLSSLVDA